MEEKSPNRRNYLVGFLEPDEAHLVEGLCQRRGMEPRTYPSAVRLRELIAASPEIVLGVFEDTNDGRGALVGALVIYTLKPGAVEPLEAGEWRDGSAIAATHLATAAESDVVYISCIVVDEGHARSALTLLMRWVDRAHFSTAYARPITTEGKAIARRLNFNPIRDGHPIWRAQREHIKRGRARAPRLGFYDRSAARLERLTRFAVPGFAAAYPIVVALVLMIVLVQFDDKMRADFSAYVASVMPRIAAPVIGAAATLGGLASTIFFLTAQLRVAGFRQYGITSVYRFRSYAPIVVLTSLTILLCLGAIGTVPLQIAGTIQLAPLLGTIGLVSFGFLIAFIFFLSLNLIANMDPVSLARRFATQLRGSDASEWGLVTISRSLIGKGYLITINPNRKNFGLRDPLMAIHELLLSSSNQRYGQILSVLAERIVWSYGLKWSMQFPDNETWEFEPLPRTKWTRVFVRNSEKAIHNRLQLVMLVLHYFRRVHRNPDMLINPDQRRQSAQFVLARLIVVLAGGLQGMPRQRDELIDVLTVCIDAILGISEDFQLSPRLSESPPFGKREGLRGLLSATIILMQRGLPEVAKHGADALGYISRMPNSALDLERVPDLEVALSAYGLSGGLRVEYDAPPYSVKDPWRTLGPPFSPAKAQGRASISV